MLQYISWMAGNQILDGPETLIRTKYYWAKRVDQLNDVK